MNDNLTIELPREAALEIQRWIDEEKDGERLVGSPTRYEAMIATRQAIAAADRDAWSDTAACLVCDGALNAAGTCLACARTRTAQQMATLGPRKE